MAYGFRGLRSLGLGVFELRGEGEASPLQEPEEKSIKAFVE